MDNVVEGLVLGAGRGASGEAYFVTDGEPVVFREFVTALLRTQGVEPPDRSLPAWTAALYNGGAVNVKRMRAGLIGSLRETQKYMQAVPQRTARLDRVLG